MNDSMVYWYEARVNFCGHSQRFLFKSDFLYEVGDKITKRYKSGAILTMTIVYGYGTTAPEHIIANLKNRVVWPFILSEI